MRGYLAASSGSGKANNWIIKYLVAV